MIEIYAISDRVPDELPANGLRAVCGDGLVALCAPAREEELSAERLWEREAVIEALMEQCDLLPARYGTRLADEAAAERALAERRAELSEALERVRGAVELSVRVLGDEPEPLEEPPTSGKDYLRAKARRATAEAATAGGVHGPLAALARASTKQGGRAERELLRAAYLVDRGAVGHFVESVEGLQQANPHLRLLCTGPWPPYSFAGS